ncbi:MAG TPA: acetate--CoA ligase family protein [Spirochaetota bacterium]|nr:acetate--CoA ligase family protein [Spirochaetota bacterium]HOM10437.1 acetate--CoA ligase family protein [Spirochaetota bacterium]HPP50183.1 acetate--CoA ligase family protein [Spirochaetota bacterium]
MTKEVSAIIQNAQSHGWVMEHQARQIFLYYGLPVSRYAYAESIEAALSAAKNVRYPLVAKVVSPEVIHKSDVGGVVVGISNDNQLKEVFLKFTMIKGFKGILLDSLQSGVEMIVGSKRDPQFGPVVLVGIGGTSVEIYKDVAIRMAPMTRNEALKAIESLKGVQLLKGFRGHQEAHISALAALLAKFSTMVIDLADAIKSIDCNPVMVNTKRAVIADARIIL